MAIEFVADDFVFESNITNTSWQRLEGSLLPLVFVPVIFPKNAQDEPATPANGDQKTNHGDAGVAENLE
jgi:hypothetical protein